MPQKSESLRVIVFSQVFYAPMAVGTLQERLGSPESEGNTKLYESGSQPSQLLDPLI